MQLKFVIMMQNLLLAIADLLFGKSNFKILNTLLYGTRDETNLIIYG